MKLGVIFLNLTFFATLWVVNGEKVSVFKIAKTEATEEAAFNKLTKMESDMKSGVDSLIKTILPMALRLSSEVDLSEKCMGSLLKTLFAIRELKLWAIQMLDASGKPGAGILTGTTSQMGSYHECMRVVIPTSNRVQKGQASPAQTGRFCIVTLRPPLPPRPEQIVLFDPVFHHINATFKTELMNFVNGLLFASYEVPMKFGFCIPSDCQEEDLNQILQYAGKQIGINTEVESCEVPEAIRMSTLQIIISALLLSCVIICLFATVISEIHQLTSGQEKGNLKESYARQILRSFSIVTNFRKLFDTKPATKRSLDAMNGIRYISATWVIMGHGYFIFNRNLLRETFNFKEMKDDFFLTAITGAFMSVESFILVTGVLLSYNIVMHFDNSRTYTPIINVLRRIWRFLPNVFVMTGVMILLPLLTSGPDYKETMVDLANCCKDKWWTNLIFITNFMPLNQGCLQHLWYISVDMQLFLLSIVYFYLLFRKPLYGNAFLAVCTLIAIVSSGAVTYIMGYPPASIISVLDLKRILEFFRNVYALPHVHLGIYSFGLFLGTHLARNKETSVTKAKAAIAWIMAVCVGITVVYAVYPWNVEAKYTVFEAVVFSATQRTIWGICLGWLVYGCYVGKGGYVNNILSWPGFQPLVKISYGLYLVHVPVYLVYYSSRLGNQDVSNSALIFNYFGTLITSHILAVFLRLFYEAPCIELERVFCSWLTSRAKNKKSKPADKEQREEIYMRKNSISEQEGVENGAFKIHM